MKKLISSSKLLLGMGLFAASIFLNLGISQAALEHTTLNKITSVDASAPHYSGEGFMLLPGEIRDFKIPFGSTSTLRGFTFEIVDKTKCDDIVVSTDIVKSTQPATMCVSTMTVRVNNNSLTKGSHKYEGIVNLDINRDVIKKSIRVRDSLRVPAKLEYSTRKDYGYLTFTLRSLGCRKTLQYRIRVEGFTN